MEDETVLYVVLLSVEQEKVREILTQQGTPLLLKNKTFFFSINQVGAFFLISCTILRLHLFFFKFSQENEINYFSY